MWCVYILFCQDGTYYTGVAKNLKDRVAQHNEGVGAKYTRGRIPVILVYSENCEGRSVALKREAAIKKLTRSQKELLIGGSKELDG